MVKKSIIKASAKLLKKAKPKAGMVARRNMLRGETTAEKFKKTMGTPKAERAKKPSTKASYIEGALTGSAATAATYTYLKSKKAKEAKAKETKAKLKKSIEKKREEDKKKKDAYGKRAPKKDKYYGGR